MFFNVVFLHITYVSKFLLWKAIRYLDAIALCDILKREVKLDFGTFGGCVKYVKCLT